MSDTFTITASGDDRRTVLTVLGYLDIATAEKLRSRIDDLDTQHVALDLGSVDFIDSSGLRALLETQESVTASGRTFTIDTLSANARRLIEMTGLLDHFGLTDAS